MSMKQHNTDQYLLNARQQDDRYDVVARMHGVSRFGHSSRFSDFVSTNETQRNDYRNGVVALSILMLIFFAVWMCCLFWFKFYYGYRRVGCAAGGQVLDMKQLRLIYGIRKRQRRAMAVRSWRIQVAFVIAAACIPVATIMMKNAGMNPFFLHGLPDMMQFTDNVDSVAYRGIQIVSALRNIQPDLRNFSSALNSNSSNLLVPDIEHWCPVETALRNYSNGNHNSSTSSSNSTRSVKRNQTNQTTGGVGSVAAAPADVALFHKDLLKLQETVKNDIKSVTNFIEHWNLPAVTVELTRVTAVIQVAETSMEQATNQEWMLQMYLLILNVVNAFLVVGVLMSKNKIVYRPYRALLSMVLVPVLIALILTGLFATCVALSGAMLHADFCSGGLSPGSPLGTVQEILLHRGYPASSLAYQSLMYYTSPTVNCSSSIQGHPLVVFQEHQARAVYAAEKVRSVTKTLDYDNSGNGWAALYQACSGNGSTSSNSSSAGDAAAAAAGIQQANATLHKLDHTLHVLAGNLRAAVDVTSCSHMSQILSPLMSGGAGATTTTTCTTAVQGSAWLSVCLLITTCLCLILLSCRAALFNAIIAAPKKNRRREKEFQDYKDFMSRYYNDTDHWKLDPVQEDEDSNNDVDNDVIAKAKSLIEKHHQAELRLCSSTDTGSTTTSSSLSSPCISEKSTEMTENHVNETAAGASPFERWNNNRKRVLYSTDDWSQSSSSLSSVEEEESVSSSEVNHSHGVGSANDTGSILSSLSALVEKTFLRQRSQEQKPATELPQTVPSSSTSLWPLSSSLSKKVAPTAAGDKRTTTGTTTSTVVVQETPVRRRPAAAAAAAAAAASPHHTDGASVSSISVGVTTAGRTTSAASREQQWHSSSPTTPAILSSRLPAAPQKRLSRLGRTQGGAKLKW